jgi:transcriptional regulator with XRE-family HTH domain
MARDLRKLLQSNIKKFREQKGMSQEVLAGFSGISSDYLSQIERGLYAPSLETLDAIADALGIEPYLLLKEL